MSAASRTAIAKGITARHCGRGTRATTTPSHRGVESECGMKSQALKWAWLCLLLGLLRGASAVCTRSLGIPDVSLVPDSRFRASSYLFDQIPSSNHYVAHYARLNEEGGGGSWCSADDPSRTPYIQVDLARNKLVSAILTQGRHQGAEYVTDFRVTYQRDLERNWRSVTEINKAPKTFKANNDTSSVARNDFPHAVVARKIRVYPQGDLFRIYCLRLDLLGCEWNKDFLQEYQAPPGMVSMKYDFRDVSYDGSFDATSGMLRGGLGELADGNYGKTSSRHKAAAFVGYNQTEFEITLRLSEARLADSITFSISNIESIAQLYSSVVMETSEDGGQYKVASFRRGPSQLDRYEKTLKVTLNLNRMRGRFIRATFKQKPRQLLLISEIDLQTSALPVFRLPTTSTAARGATGGVGWAVSTPSNSNDPAPTLSPEELRNLTNGNILTPVGKKTTTRAQSFYIIIGVAVFLLMLLAVGIVLLVWHFRKEKRIRQRLAITRTYPDGKPSSTDGTECEPLLRLSEFQGAAGTSVYMTPEAVHGNGFPVDKEIPRTAVDFAQRIGGGKHGEVFSGQIVLPKEGAIKASVQSLLGHRVHISVMKRGASVEASIQFHQEIRQLACLNHVNVCRLVAVCSNTEPLYVVLEASDNMRLDKYLYAGLQQETKSRRLDILTDIGRQMASALVYLSSIQFVHRDISVRNVLCNANGCVKLSNTAAASAAYYDCYYYVQERNGLYPVRWMPPEAIARLQFSAASDVWSFGVMLWEMFMLGSNRPLACFTDTRVIAILKEMHQTGDRGQDYLQCPQCCPAAIYTLMRNCWRVTPDQRVQPEELYDALSAAK